MSDDAHQLDPATLAIINAIRAFGYVVSLRYEKTTWTATAKNLSGDTWISRAGDPYIAVVELAQQVGIDLEDG